MVMFIPSIIISIVIIKWVDLSKLKSSRFGKYMRVHMTTVMEAVRFMGFALAILGAWFHFSWLIGCGILVIIFGWVRGMILFQNRT